MRDRGSDFDVLLPGIAAGMILAGIVLATGDNIFPDAFQKAFPHETFLLLAVALVAAGVIGFVSLLLPPREEEKSRENVSYKFPSGGPDVP
jgi:hypothetical protein